MSYGPVKAFTCGIASGASTSSYLDLGKSNTQWAVNAVTMSTGTVLAVWGSATPTGTYYPLHYRIASGTAQYNAITISTAMSGAWSILDPIPFQYVAFVATSVVSGGVSITVLTQD